jgi:hypothetical protein
MQLRLLRRLLLGLVAICVTPTLSTGQRSRVPGPPDPAAVAALAGCYSLRVGAWSKAVGSGPPAPPETIRLDTARLAAGQRGYQHLAQIPGEVGNSWTPIGADSLQVITWLARFDAEVLFLRQEGDSLRGFARRATDAIPVDSTGEVRWDVWPAVPVMARPIACIGGAAESRQ